MASLNDYKSKVKTMFLENRNLQKYIYYNTTNPLAEPIIKNPFILFEDPLNPDPKESPRIYFKFKNPDTITQETTFILVNYLEYPIGNSLAFNKVSVVFSIITHNTLTELSDGRSRVIAIKDEIDKYMNGNKHLGFKRAKSNGIRSINVGSDFTGINLIYEVIDRSMNYHNESGS